MLILLLLILRRYDCILYQIEGSESRIMDLGRFLILLIKLLLGILHQGEILFALSIQSGKFLLILDDANLVLLLLHLERLKSLLLVWNKGYLEHLILVGL